MKRLERLQAMILEFKSRRLLTAQELSVEFGITQRTVYRDIRSLQASGFPIQGEAGVGYQLDRSFLLSPVVLDENEGVALLTAAKFIEAFPDQATKGYFENALKKIRSILPRHLQDKLEFFDGYIKVLSKARSRKSQENNDVMSQVRESLYLSRVLEINYVKPNGLAVSTRQIEPLGLVFYGYHWHLIAWCRERRDYRDFRMDRMVGVRVCSEKYRLSDRINLAEYGEIQTSRVHIHHVSVIFSEGCLHRVRDYRSYWGFTGEECMGPDGAQMDFAVPHLEGFARWLLSFTNQVKIIESKELKKVYRDLIGQFTEVL